MTYRLGFISECSKRCLVLALALAWLFPATPVLAQKIEPEADAVLRSMSDHLASLSAFRINLSATTEILLLDGRKIQLTGDTKVVADRSKGFRVERNGAAGKSTLVFDGQKVSIESGPAGQFAAFQVEGSFDVALDEVRMVFGAEAMGGADLLYSNPYEGLMIEAESARYLGVARIGGQTAHHLSYRAKDIDWQIWVAAEGEPLPVRYVITSKWMTAAPQFTANHVIPFSRWGLGCAGTGLRDDGVNVQRPAMFESELPDGPTLLLQLADLCQAR